jgi:hypothetical protein
MIHNFKVGADPELFFIKDNKAFSAEGLIGGSKEFPKFIGNNGCALQEDNVMAEFNIPPSNNKTEFNNNVQFMLDTLDTIAKSNGADLLITPSAKFDKKSLSTLQAKEFGCSPDLNAYSFTQNPRVEINEDIRVAGGHIHIGYNNPDPEINLVIVRVLDIFLGLPSILLDKDDTRKEYYGNAGSYRNKTYGVEYRTLSNFWIKTKELREWVFNQIELAINFINNNEFTEISENQWSSIELAINDSDESLALALEQEITKKISTENN